MPIAYISRALSDILTKQVLQVSDFDIFSLDDVDAAFSQIHQLKFQQELRLTGPVLASFTILHNISMVNSRQVPF